MASASRAAHIWTLLLWPAASGFAVGAPCTDLLNPPLNVSVTGRLAFSAADPALVVALSGAPAGDVGTVPSPAAPPRLLEDLIPSHDDTARTVELLLERADWEYAACFQVGPGSVASKAPRLALLAVAEAGSGNDAVALCLWEAAVDLMPALRDVDLTPYGRAGRLLQGAARAEAVDTTPRPARATGADQHSASVAGFTSASPRSGPAPAFTEMARRARLEGKVIILVLIDENGAPRRPRLLKGMPMGLDSMALRALCYWQFEPARQGGVPTSAWHEVTLTFELAPQDLPELHIIY
jgi:TonB family protein